MTVPSLVQFYVNRIIRVAPLYYLAVITSVFFLSRDFAITPIQLFHLLTFTENDPQVFQRLYPLSIVSTQMQFYLVAPIVYVIVKGFLTLFPIWFSGFLIFIIGAITRYALFLQGNQDYASWFSYIYITVIGNIDLFLFGTLLAIVINQKNVKQIVKAKIQNGMNFFPLVVCLWYVWGNYLMHYVGDIGRNDPVKYQLVFLFPPVTSLIIGIYIYCISIQQNGKFIPISKPKEIMRLFLSPKKILFGIGTLSYGIYIWHYPVLDFIFYRASVVNNFQEALYRFTIGICLIIPLSLITYIGIEYPMYKLKKFIQK